MKAVVVDQPRSYELREVPRPRCGDDDVLVRIECCSICASDFEILYGLNEEEVTYPIIPGHEWSGEVVEAGANCRDLIGKRVTGDNVTGCGVCPSCRSGKPHLCRDKREIGFSVNGAYAEYLAVPGANIVVLPTTLEYEIASLAEPTAVCLRALGQAGLRPAASEDASPAQTSQGRDRTVAIIGDGPIGLLTAILARQSGVSELMIAGHHSERLDLCAEWTGSRTVNTHDVSLEEAAEAAFGRQVDVILETTGRGSVVAESLAVLEQSATLCLVGSYRENVELNPNDLVLREQNIIGSVSYTRPELDEAVQLLGGGLLDGRNFLTHTFPLDDYASALEMVETRADNVIKACFAAGQEGPQ